MISSSSSWRLDWSVQLMVTATFFVVAVRGEHNGAGAERQADTRAVGLHVARRDRFARIDGVVVVRIVMQLVGAAVDDDEAVVMVLHDGAHTRALQVGQDPARGAAQRVELEGLRHDGSGGHAEYGHELNADHDVDQARSRLSCEVSPAPTGMVRALMQALF